MCSKFFIFLIILILGVNTYAQELKKYRFSEVEKLIKIKEKPIMLFVSTSWCKYCKVMQKTTFQNKAVISELNKNYYFLELEADSEEEIVFQNKIYKFKPHGVNMGYNEILGYFLKKDQIVFPSVILLDSNWKPLFLMQSKLNSKQFLEFFSVKK